MKDKHILLHVTGSISCYKACELTSLLVKEGAEVQVTMSEGALKFLQPAVFEGLSHREALTPDMFAWKPDCIPHITLAQKWADLIIVYPASANCIARLAGGLCDDLFGSTFLANNFEKPVLLAPAMNSNMFAHPALQENLKKLESWGTKILPTEEGRLACGSVGLGKLISPEKVLEYIKEAL
ncbi:flavoprotein [Treponema sp. UBA3813]|uniref:flavoprotein n=1 Tax=Treponema sp. UBA3813 TaxID=1947715 RepID=UPI0025D06EBF|nr:flavoprotein [Treponema sp. UBA3813]